MDGDQDPISELREALRRRSPTWEPEHTPRRLPAVPQLSHLRRARPIASRSSLTRVRPPDLHTQVAIDSRRVRGATSRMLRSSWRMLRSARPHAVAVIAATGGAGHRVVRAADRGVGALIRARRVAGRWLRQAGAWSVATAARVPLRRAVQPAALLPNLVEADPVRVVGDVGERHLEDLERRQLEQRIEALGPDHPDVAILLQLAAERCAAHGAPDEALGLYGQALRIQEATFGPDSPALRPLLRDLAELELELGHDGDALLHRARREMLEPRPAAPAEPIRLNGVLVSRTSDTPNGVSRST